MNSYLINKVPAKTVQAMPDVQWTSTSALQIKILIPKQKFVFLYRPSNFEIRPRVRGGWTASSAAGEGFSSFFTLKRRLPPAARVEDLDALGGGVRVASIKGWGCARARVHVAKPLPTGMPGWSQRKELLAETLSCQGLTLFLIASRPKLETADAGCFLSRGRERISGNASRRVAAVADENYTLRPRGSYVSPPVFER